MSVERFEAFLREQSVRNERIWFVVSVAGACIAVAALTVLGFWLDAMWIRWVVAE